MSGQAVVAQVIEKRYGAVEALKDVTLQIGRGEIYGLLGANGAGKTTFIKLLVGATRANRGQLRILGLDPLRENQRLHPLIGYMPQAPALYDDLSAADNVRFFGLAHAVPNLTGRVQATLDFVGLNERSRQKVGTFSGGMKQRVSLACALVHEPQLLLLDEPTAGVDVKLRAAFWEHFKALAAQGVTLLVSTHQMDEAIHCDRLAILREGQLLLEGSPLELLQSGAAQVKVWRSGKESDHVLDSYARDLPQLLQSYGLDPAVERIEVHLNSLETVVLELIEPARKNP